MKTQRKMPPRGRVGGAGVIVLVHHDVVPAFSLIIRYLNRRARVSDEVYSLHLVKPSIRAVYRLAEHLKRDPHHTFVENISNLRPNNSLRDLLAKRKRLTDDQVANYMMLVSIETVTDKFRAKYPNPNLTLQAGSVEKFENIVDAGVRELFEEAKIRIDQSKLFRPPIKLLGGGLFMYMVHIGKDTRVSIGTDDDSVTLDPSPPPGGAWRRALPRAGKLAAKNGA